MITSILGRNIAILVGMVSLMMTPPTFTGYEGSLNTVVGK